MKLKYKLLSMLAMVGVVGSGFAAWQFGEQTTANASVNISIAGYSRVGEVQITNTPAYTLDTLNSGANSNPVLFTAAYNPLSATDAIDVSGVTLTYKITFNAALNEYVYPSGEDPAGSGIATGTWISGTQVSHPILWRTGKNPQNILAHQAIEALLDTFSINIEVFANLGAPAPLGAPDTIEIQGAPVSGELELGQTLQLSAVAKASGNANGVDQGVSWSSSAPLIADVNASGLVEAKAIGSARISATSTYTSPMRRAEGDVVGYVDIEVVAVAPDLVPTQISLSASTLSVEEDDIEELPTVTIKNVGNQVLTHNAVWSVVAGGTGEVDISDLPYVEGVTAGTVTLRATAQGYPAVYADLSVTVTVKAAPAAYHDEIVIAWTGSVDGGIEIGAGAAITITHLDQYGQVWSGLVGDSQWDIYVFDAVEDDYVAASTATVNGANSFSASAAGNYRVYLMAENAAGDDYITSNHIDVIVKAAYVPVGTKVLVSAAGGATTIEYKDSLQLSASVVDGTYGDVPVAEQGVSWAVTTGAASASVDANGRVTATAAPASITVTATSTYYGSGTVVGTINLSTYKNTLVATTIELSTEDDVDTIEVGDDIQIIATVYDQYGDVFTGTPSITWSDDGEGFGEVDSDGLVTGIAEGSVVVMAELPNEASDIIEITIEEAEVVVPLYMEFTFTSAKTGQASDSTALTTTQFKNAVVTNNSADISNLVIMDPSDTAVRVYGGASSIKFSSSSKRGYVAFDVVETVRYIEFVAYAHGSDSAIAIVNEDTVNPIALSATETLYKVTIPAGTTSIGLRAQNNSNHRFYVKSLKLFRVVPAPEVADLITVSGSQLISTSGTSQLSASSTKSNSELGIDQEVTWSIVSGPGSISATGLVTSSGVAGTIVARATSVAYAPLYGEISIDVQVPVVSSVVIEDGAETVDLTVGGANVVLEAVAYDQFDAPITGYTFNWLVTSGGSYASIGASSGELTPLAEGEAVVTVNVVGYPGIIDTIDVNVADASSQVPVDKVLTMICNDKDNHIFSSATGSTYFTETVNVDGFTIGVKDGRNQGSTPTYVMLKSSAGYIYNVSAMGVYIKSVVVTMTSTATSGGFLDAGFASSAHSVTAISPSGTQQAANANNVVTFTNSLTDNGLNYFALFGYAKNIQISKIVVNYVVME